MKTKFYTGEGDSGVSIIGKQVVSKDSCNTVLLGSLDECCCWLGLCSVYSKGEMKIWIERLEEMVFICQAEVSTIAFGQQPGAKTYSIHGSHVVECEEIIQEIDKKVPPIKSFVMPGGTILSAHCDVARTVARRAEREAITASKKDLYSKEFLSFLNRLSSVLFALGRYANLQEGVSEKHPSYK